MVEKVLHAGNIAVAFSSVATAADLTVTGGAGAAISASLSATDLFKRSSDKDARPLAQKMAAHMQDVLDRSHLTEGRKRVATQMLALYPPSKSDLAAGNMDAPTVATTLRARVADTATDPAHKTDTALDDFAGILADTLAPFLEPQDHKDAMLQELLARTGSSGQSDRLRNEGITETAIIRLAQRIARETDNLGQAWLDLQNAMDIAVRVQQEGRLPSNHGDFVDEVLARVTGLAAEGEYTAASDAIATALEAEDARRARLLDRGIEIAMLEGNSTTAAAYLIRKADLEVGGAVDFDAIRAIFITHYKKGRDKGIAINLEISIALARLVLTRASTADERGTALNDLGASLQTLGDRESGTDRLEEAVIAYRSALMERTRDRVPLDWAMTQMNLGNALATLGQRESGIARLEEAVTAYRAALAERTRDRVPLDWAGTQMNLGNALAILGERESGTARLEEAVIAYRNALAENTRDRVPLDWARTQMNLGNALRALGERESGTARLEEAVIAYRAALAERTRDRVPLEWAMTQMNLGTALQTLGERESGTARLEEAVTAYRAALEERTRDRVPLEWAMTQANLAHLERAVFDKTGEAKHLERAEAHARAAQEVFHAAGASHYEEKIERTLSTIAARRGG